MRINRVKTSKAGPWQAIVVPSIEKGRATSCRTQEKRKISEKNQRVLDPQRGEGRLAESRVKKKDQYNRKE